MRINGRSQQKQGATARILLRLVLNIYNLTNHGTERCSRFPHHGKMVGMLYRKGTEEPAKKCRVLIQNLEACF